MQKSFLADSSMSQQARTLDLALKVLAEVEAAKQEDRAKTAKQDPLISATLILISIRRIDRILPKTM
jgi:hypothetical protein